MPAASSCWINWKTAIRLQQEQASQELAAIASRVLVPRPDAHLSRRLITRVRRQLVLGAVGTPAAMAVLVSGLADEDLTPRRNAAQRVLLEMDVEAVPALMVGLPNQSPLTAPPRRPVLGFIKSPRAVNPLLRVAQSDEEAGVRQEAVWALGEIGEARVMLALKAISRNDPDLGGAHRGRERHAARRRGFLIAAARPERHIH